VEGKPAGSFKRTITLESKEAPAGLWFRAAAGKLDGRVKVAVEGGVMRGTELLVPVSFASGKATIVVTYVW
jgi:hypothetical protein